MDGMKHRPTPHRRESPVARAVGCGRDEEDGNPPALGAGNTAFDSRVPDHDDTKAGTATGQATRLSIWKQGQLADGRSGIFDGP